MPCSIIEGEEGFGSNVLCSACWFDDVPNEETEVAQSSFENENMPSEEMNAEKAKESQQKIADTEPSIGIFYRYIRK